MEVDIHESAVAVVVVAVVSIAFVGDIACTAHKVELGVEDNMGQEQGFVGSEYE